MIESSGVRERDGECHNVGSGFVRSGCGCSETLSTVGIFCGDLGTVWRELSV